MALSIPVFEEGQLEDFLRYISRDSSMHNGVYCIRTSWETEPHGQLDLWPSQAVLHSYGLKGDWFKARAIYKRSVKCQQDPSQLRKESMALLGKLWEQLTPPTDFPYLNFAPDRKSDDIIVTNKIRGLSAVVDHNMRQIEAARRGHWIRT